MAGLFEQFDSQKNKSSGGLFAEFDPQKNTPSGGLFAEFMKPSWTDPADSLPPVERDRAIQRRRSKMGTEKNMNPSVITEVEQPKTFWQKAGETIKNIITDPFGSLERGAKAIDESDSFIARNLSAGSAQLAESWNTTLGGYDRSRDENTATGADILIRESAEKLIPRGDQTIPGQLIQTIPQMAGSVYSTLIGGPLGAFGFSLGSTYGSAYGQARDAGASHEQARTAALLQAIPQAAIEATGGVERIIGQPVKQGFLRTVGRAALEEGLEEVAQYPFEGLSKKLTYAPETPIASVKESAILNPVEMGQNALVGGLAGGLFGGATNVITNGVRLPKPKQAPVQQQAAPTADFTPIGGKPTQVVEGLSVQQGFTPIGGEPTQQEFTPIRGKPEPNIPQGEKLLSFPQTMADSDTTAAELKQMIKDNPLSYQPINNPDTLKLAQQIVDQNFEAAKRVVMEGESFSNATESAMAQDIIRRLQNERKWDDAFEVMEVTARKAKASGQAIQVFAMWRRMTPEGMLKYAHRVISQAQEAGAKNAKLTPEFADRLTDAMERINQTTDPTQLQALIKEQAGKMPKWTEKMISKKTTEQLKDIAIAQVLSDIADQVPSSVWKKLSAIQAFSHLINAKTAGRNIYSTISFSIAEKLSNIVATPIDFAISKFTGKRSLTLPQTGKESIKAGIEQAKEAAIDIALGINRTGVRDGKYNVPRGKTFKKGAGRMAEKLLGYELVVPDEFFKGEVFYDVLQQLMKVEGLTQPTQEMIEYAQLRARYATFQDDSLPARILQGLKDLANKIGGGQEIRGRSGMMTHEFGAGDLLIKYTTVPGNIIARSVEYTPMGMFKILSIANNAKMSGKVKQSEIAMTIGRSVVGTTCFIGLGALLKHLGLLISEDRDRGKNATALDRAEGLGNYKVNMSAFGRLVNGQDPTPQYGDHLVSYNWLEPVGVTLAVGATIYDETHKDGTIPEIVFNSANAAMEEILDLPTLSVIRQMTYQDNVFDALITPFVQGVSGFIPSPIRQTAQMLDPVARDTKGNTPIETMGKRIQTSIPLWREGLEPKIAPFGGEIEYPTSVWNSLLNPGQTSIYTPSTVTEDLKRLEDITGSNTHYPREKAPKSFDFNSVTYELTPEEKTLYMRIEGEALLKMYERILANGYTEQTAAGIVKALESAKSTAHEIAKREILRRRGIIR